MSGDVVPVERFQQLASARDDACRRQYPPGHPMRYTGGSASVEEVLEEIAPNVPPSLES